MVAVAASFGHLALELQVGEELAPTLDAWHSLIHLLVQVKEIAMDWDALGAMGEIIGAIAVIGTLYYLSNQIKLNSKLLRLTHRISSSRLEDEFETQWEKISKVGVQNGSSSRKMLRLRLKNRPDEEL